MVPLHVDGEHTGFYAIYRDITERIEHERTQAALHRIAEMAGAALDMQEFYAGMHAVVGELMNAENFFIALYDADARRDELPLLRGLGRSPTSPIPSSGSRWAHGDAAGD